MKTNATALSSKTPEQSPLTAAKIAPAAAHHRGFEHYTLLCQPIDLLFTDKMDKSGICSEDSAAFDTLVTA